MKVISKEEEQAHYSRVIEGGLIGGAVGFLLGLGGVLGANRRYAAFRSLTIQFRTFLVSSSTTAGAIIVAERYSIAFQRQKNPMAHYKDEAQQALEAATKRDSPANRLVSWGRENRYTICLGAWVASMGGALAMVGRNRHMTVQQKLVQARMYAQGLTLVVMMATAALETADARSGKGKWETVQLVDPEDPARKKVMEKKVRREDYAGQDLWKDMVATEERRLKAQSQAQKAAKAAPEASSSEKQQSQRR